VRKIFARNARFSVEFVGKNPIKTAQRKDFAVFTSVALTYKHHYNARAEHRPAWTEHKQYATHRRFMDGRGVFSVGGKREMTARVEEKVSASPGNVIVRVFLAQLGLTTVLAMLFWGIDGRVSAYSSLLGGLTCVIPNAFLALRLVVPRRDAGAGALIRAAYVGEIGKLAITVLMFTMVFTLVRPLAALPLFAGFIAAQMVTFSGLLMRDKETEVSERKSNGE
jgi:ATP synthase protein I